MNCGFNLQPLRFFHSASTAGFSRALAPDRPILGRRKINLQPGRSNSNATEEEYLLEH